MNFKIKVFALACIAAAILHGAVECPATARQNWPWDSRVVIDTTIPEGANSVEVSATFKHDGVYTETAFTSGCKGFSGKTDNVASGEARFLWDPIQCGYTGKIEELQVKVNAYTFNERAWLVIDMKTGSHEYVALGDEPKDDIGKPWQEDKYKTSKMVFRRIPAGTFVRGYTQAEKEYLWNLDGGNSRILSAAETTLTSDYYISIYLVTTSQANLIQDPETPDPETVYGGKVPFAGKTLAAGAVCFQRGSNRVEGINWPVTKFAVKPGCWIDKFRERCSNKFMIDLPTCAQWMKAARPDTQWLWYDTSSYAGGMTGGKIGDSLDTITNIVDAISHGYEVYVTGAGRYSPPWAPGLYLPNSYGMCDLIGSRVELLLDYWDRNDDGAAEGSAGIDPVGLESLSYGWRMLANTFNTPATVSNWSLGHVDVKGGDSLRDPNTEYCFRYVIHLNPPQSFGGKWFND